MEIQYLHLAGFKKYSQGTDLHLATKNENLLDSQGDDLHYHLNVILGIIFGFGEIEKQEFRDSDGAHIFTGLIHIQLDDRVLIIERDFETDIMACMLDFQGTSKVVFHDRDFVENGRDRTYLRFIQQYFAFTNKHLISQLIFLLIDVHEPDLREVLSKLYILLSPKLQIKQYKKSIKDYENLLKKPAKKEASKIGKKLLSFENKKQKIRSSLKIQKQNDELTQTDEIWKLLDTRVAEKQNELLQLKELLNQKFPLLKEYDGKQLRKDIIVWKELISEKAEYDKMHTHLQTKIDQTEKILNGELLLYRSIPPTFESDIKDFYERTETLKKNNAALQEIKKRIEQLEEGFRKKRKLLIGLVSLLPLAGGLTALLLFKLSLLLSGFVLLVLAGIFGGLYASQSTRQKSDLWIQNFEESRLKNENIEIEHELMKLRSKSILVEDYAHRETHIDRHKRARELKRQLDNLIAERKTFSESWKNHDGFKKIQDFNLLYGKVIDLSRDDLHEYLENFSELKLLMGKYELFDTHLLLKIKRYRKIFRLIAEKLNQLNTRLIESSDLSKSGFSPKELLNKLEDDIYKLKKDPDSHP